MKQKDYLRQNFKISLKHSKYRAFSFTSTSFIILSQIISRSLVVSDIQTNFFFDCIHTEYAKRIHKKEEAVWNHDEADPSNTEENAKILNSQELSFPLPLPMPQL